MILFKRYIEIKEDYPQDCEKIWNYINKRGIVYFERNKLERLYREFSEEKYSAGFMIPSIEILEKFCDWLEEQN